MSENLFTLENRVVVVVGSGSGIGEAVALGAAGHGARVECLDVKADTAEATAAQIRSGGVRSGAYAIIAGTVLYVIAVRAERRVAAVSTQGNS